MKAQVLGVLLFLGLLLAPLASAEDGDPEPCEPYQATALRPVIVEDRSDGTWMFIGVPESPGTPEPGEAPQYQGSWIPIVCEDDPIPPGNGEPTP